ncbi:sodium:solute symporter family protein [Bremerella sp. T1]|uniref:sodium:solute symporter family protein n=1 Tax=Bremerella sp. TYQ1 TaxID=3119568 RepID=UPI001CCE6429|nr:sodium:solute symporter family protein [Bremerella volcania]UBM36629.1 sodium:solute symporter family protein [Bremerella volcania]
MTMLDTIVTATYFLALVVLVISGRRAKSMVDFAVGSREIPGTIVFATLSATVIGPGYSMGLANKVAGDGLIWLLIFFAFSAQTVLIGMFVAPRLREFTEAVSVGDVIGYRYGALCKVVTGILSVLLCTGIVGAIAKATGDILASATGLPFLWCVIGSTVVVVAYSTFGGIKSDIISDVFQFIVLAATFPLVLFMMHTEFGLPELLEGVSTETSSLSGPSGLQLFSLVLAFFLGETLIPPYVNRAYAAANPRQARLGFLLTGGFSVAWFIVCASIGLLGRGVVDADSENVFMATLMYVLPSGLLGLAFAAMFSIIMSSQDSLLNAAAVSLQNDVLGQLTGNLKNHIDGIKLVKVITVLIGVTAMSFALVVPGIVEALMVCYTLWAPTIVLPLIIAVLMKGAHPYAGASAIFAGALATVAWEWILHVPYGIPSLLVGVTVNQAVFWSVQCVVTTSPRNKWFAPLSESQPKEST